VPVVEVSQHREDGVALPDLLEGLGVQRFVFDLALADGYRVRHVEARVGRLAGVEDLRQRIDPLVGHFDSDGGMPVAAPLPFAPERALKNVVLPDAAVPMMETNIFLNQPFEMIRFLSGCSLREQERVRR